MRRAVRGIWLGRRPYGPTLELQQQLNLAVRDGVADSTVLFLEHEPVVTLGRGADDAHLLLSEAHLRERGFAVERTDRGGDVTVHAPGQLVAYPIFDLRPDRCDVRRYVGDLTETMRRVVAGYGISAGPVDGMIGLWVDAETPDVWEGPEAAGRLAKVGAVGVRISRWVTLHGFALNLTTDLSSFSWVVPCGIHAHGVTSVEALTGVVHDVGAVARAAYEKLVDVFDMDAAPLQDMAQAPLSSLVPAA
jgi:lipoyl(octanoyl) transferase